MEENKKAPLLKKRDLIIVVVLLLVAVAGMAATKFFSPNSSTQTARIYVGANLYKEVALDEDQVVEIDQGSGMVNHVEVKDGAIHMMDSTCSDKQCVYQGEVSPENYENRALRNWIVCLPNGVTIELVLADEG